MMLVTLVSATSIAHIYKAQTFEEKVSDTVITNPSKPAPEKKDADRLLEIFEQVNNRGTHLAVLVSFVIVGLITWTLTETIDRPLRGIERAISQFNRGNLNARIPPSDIPELHRLGLTLNSVASRLQGVEERRREVIGDLAHELGNPLTVIRGYLELMSHGEMSLTPSVGQQLHEEAERMARLLEDLKTLSKVETGNLPLHLQVVDPNPLLNSVVRALSVRNRKGIRLELNCSRNLPEVFADPDRVRQVLINLISNALNYTEQGRVIVRAWNDDTRIWVEVSDTGVGIAPEDLPRVFDRFWRSESSRRQNACGTGIGLAITKHLVEVQGGQINVESELNKGTVFRFSLPLATTELA
ncbi:HAMP domain-containing protein (plasmid) [Phormidium sp. CLA17]|nr:HAMP domain-containing protein [Leptolyngbya sp. Cla-17]